MRARGEAIASLHLGEPEVSIVVERQEVRQPSPSRCRTTPSRNAAHCWGSSARAASLAAPSRADRQSTHQGHTRRRNQPRAGRDMRVMRPNLHVIVPSPGADPRACARVERTTALVDEILASPAGRRLDPTWCSFGVHIASGWLGERRGFEASWEEFDPGAFLAALPDLGFFSTPVLVAMLDSLRVAFRWMAEHGRMKRGAAERCADVLRAARLQLAPEPRRRRPIQRTRRFHRNWH